MDNGSSTKAAKKVSSIKVESDEMKNISSRNNAKKISSSSDSEENRSSRNTKKVSSHNEIEIEFKEKFCESYSEKVKVSTPASYPDDISTPASYPDDISTPASYSDDISTPASNPDDISTPASNPDDISTSVTEKTIETEQNVSSSVEDADRVHKPNLDMFDETFDLAHMDKLASCAAAMKKKCTKDKIVTIVKSSSEEKSTQVSTVVGLDGLSDLALLSDSDVTSSLCYCTNPSECDNCTTSIVKWLECYPDSARIASVMKEYPAFSAEIVRMGMETVVQLKSKWSKLEKDQITQLKLNLHQLHKDRVFEILPDQSFTL